MTYADDAPEQDEDEKKPKVKAGGKLSDDDLKLMRERYQRGIERESKNREDARDDLKFKVGEQWPQEELNRRGDRPALTFNKMPGFIRQVTGDVRQNKPAIRIRPNGDGADKDRAEAFAGLIRNIEQQSFAGYVYSQGIDNATSCGFGAMRIVTEYMSESSFELDIRIKGIPNALSVVWDPDAKELDKSDARWCFIYSGMPKEDYKEQYPNAKAVDFEKLDNGINDEFGDWYTSDNVRIAEYWCKKPTTKNIALLSDGRVICLDDYDGEKLTEALGGATIERKREVKTHKVVQHIVSGGEELEEPTEWATDDIPIIPVLGDETWVDERVVRSGLIRHAKDAQRAYNYARSTSIEVTALQPKAPYMLSTTMIEGVENYWAQAGNASLPYLLFKSDPNLPNQKPDRIQPPVPAAGLIAEAQLAADDMKAGTGIYDASLGAKSNETSGVAIDKRKAEGDVSTFVFIDNGALAISVVGRQLVKLIPKVWDTKQRRRILFEDGTDKEITLNATQVDALGNQKVRHDPQAGFYDLNVGKYDVVVDAGPGFTTRRQEASEGIKEVMMTLGPQGAALLVPDLAKLQDWPGSTEIGEKVKRLLPPQLQDPQKGPDGQPLPPPEPPPPPEVLKAQAEMQMQQQKAQFEEGKARADMALKKESQDAEIQLQRAKAAAEIELQREKNEAELALMRERAAAELEIERQRIEAQAELERYKAEINGRISAMKIDASQEIAREREANRQPPQGGAQA